MSPVIPSSKPSMRLIAAHAGVSVVAVSSALRGGQGVSETTRTRIRAIAESLGYRPDPLLSQLMYHLRSKRPPKGRHNIAFLHWPSDPYRELVLRGARTRAEQQGYQIDIIKMGGASLSPRVLQRMLLARGISGVVLGPSPMRDFSSLLDWKCFSTVVTSYSVLGPNLHRVVPNQYSATRMAVVELTKRGYARIGLVVPSWLDEDLNFLHSAAFTRQAAQPATQPLICYYDPESNPLSELRNWYLSSRPDALVLCNPVDYETILCKALGPEVSSRLGVVSLGHTQCAATLTVDYRPATLGAIAIDQLIQQLHRGERGIPPFQQTLLVEGNMIEASAA